MEADRRGQADRCLTRTDLYGMTLCGITYVANYSSKAKHPVKDIPFVIVTLRKRGLR